ncbi:phage tail protein [Roseobacter sp. OBYS 0001]|uniref:phage tail protein n=1 Tax=Roseobacter sp. OBYS 0001 TaxID=882651 RepID=UPI001BBB2207|nr:phage tail protein [Roseobacter sp. OBYS 0001]GIT85398.1 hypothetical protein ROBYS_04140 [Roseobacter sp. OBYS 0001]
MGKVGVAVAAIGLTVATGGFGGAAFAGLSSFAAAYPIATQLLTTVALSALRAALMRTPKAGGRSRSPGIRTSQTQTGGTNPASFIMGVYATEGTLAAPMMSSGTGTNVPNAYLTYVIELGDIPGQTLQGIIVDGERVTLGINEWPGRGFGFKGRFQDHGWVKFYDGTQTAAAVNLMNWYADHPDRPWTADMIGRGIPYAICTFRYNREIYSSFPNVRFICGGIPLYDPRKDSSVGGLGAHRWADRSTWELSENPAVQIYNIKRGIDFGGGYIWGGGCDAADLPLANWWAAMNKADVAITLADGGTEPQYRTSFEVFADDEPAEIIDDLLNACSGEVAENGGVWKIRLGGPGLPVYFFTDDDILVSESEEYSPFRAQQEPYNGVAVTYPDPDALWEPRDAPARYNADYALADPAQRRVADLTLSAAPYPNQVQRIMRAYVEEERRVVRHVLTLPTDALMLEALDVVSWTSERHGYAGKAFEVDAHIDPMVSGTQRVTLKERDPDDAAWSSSFEIETTLGSSSVTPLAPQEVTGFAVAAASIEDENGDPARPAILLTWDGEQEDVRGLEYEVSAADGTSIVRGSTLNVAAGSFTVAEGILPAKDYVVRARFVVFRPAAWTALLPVTTLDLRIRPDDLDAPAFSVSGLSVFGGALRSSDFVAGTTGWQITKAGNAEFNKLIARNSLQVGAISDIYELLAPDSIGVGDGDLAYELLLGAQTEPLVQHMYLKCDVRRSSSSVTTTASFRIRYLVTGVWGDWSVPLVREDESSQAWSVLQRVGHIQGPYEAAQLQLRVGLSNNSSNPAQHNIREVVMRVQGVVR